MPVPVILDADRLPEDAFQQRSPTTNQNVSLDDYPNLRVWLKGIEALPGFVPMQATAVGLRAV